MWDMDTVRAYLHLMSESVCINAMVMLASIALSQWSHLRIVIAALTQTDSDAWCKRTLTVYKSEQIRIPQVLHTSFLG